MNQYPLIKSNNSFISSENEVLIEMIRQELKTRQFFNGLEGLDLTVDGEYRLRSNLDPLIMYTAKMWDHTDDDFNFFTSLMDKHCRQILRHDDGLTTQAIKVYVELMEYRKEHYKGLK